MKASELIKRLQECIQEHGDQDVTITEVEIDPSSPDDHIDVAGVAVGIDENDKPYNFMLCDRETLNAFFD